MINPSGAQDHTRASGMPCPRCGTPIVVEAAILLTTGQACCSGCGLRLSVDAEKSAGSLRALAAYMTEFAQHVESVSGADSGVPSGRRRATRPQRDHRPRRRGASRTRREES